MSNPTWKVKNLRWWNWPIPLYRKDPDKWVKVGYVWNQRAFIVKNMYEGWVAFLDDQTEERLSYLDVWSCDCCGAEIMMSKKRAIEKYVLEKQNEL